MEKWDNINDVNEKLYLNSYFNLLNCKKNGVNNSAPVIRDLLRQSNFHCTRPNLFVNSIDKFKSELIEEYSNIIDNEEHTGMLSANHSDEICKVDVCTPLEQIKKDQCVKDALNEFNKYLLNKNSINGSVKPNDVQSTYVGSENSNNSYIASNLKREQKCFSRVNPTTSENCGLPRKRRAMQGNYLEHIIKKYDSKNKLHKVDTKAAFYQNLLTKIKNPTSSFYQNPASSFYQNPTSSFYQNPLLAASAMFNKNMHVNEGNSKLANHESLKHFDKKIVDVILNEIMDFSPDVKWSNIAGLDFVKTTIQEIVIWPLLRPDIFTGLRAPPRGILLFGPPGTGKTLIGKCIATESNSTFFCISASSLASKYVGESEKLMRALFAVARLNQPAVIFIDEIDSLLSQRSDKEQEYSRKLKTEFLVQFDGAKTDAEERVLVVGATNRPHELDEAARRRFVKRLFVPLPEESARRQIVLKMLSANRHELSEEDLQKICDETKGYSGSDVSHLCKEAAMGPIRCIGPENIKTISLDQVRPINLSDFLNALGQVRASVAQDDLDYFVDWNKKFGSFGIIQ